MVDAGTSIKTFYLFFMKARGYTNSVCTYKLPKVNYVNVETNNSEFRDVYLIKITGSLFEGKCKSKYMPSTE